VGCGTGNLTLTAEKYAGASGSVYGIDASPEMIEVAQKKAQRNNSKTVFEVGLIEKLAFPDAMFDVVINRLTNPLIAHILSAILGPGMMHFDVSVIPPILKEVGFVNIASGKTHSAILGFVSGKKPAV
jgi:SAM-dependent methyltransferase